ncbi:hypothetical protein FRC09_010378 [Ceratobasidium sp. 395]|nr:hypothetical protein FRC09_010378 [Ceratobasidium sp. 395]
MSVYPTLGQLAHQAGATTYSAAHRLIPTPHFQGAAPSNLLDEIKYPNLDKSEEDRKVNSNKSSDDGAKSSSSSKDGDNDSGDEPKSMARLIYNARLIILSCLSPRKSKDLKRALAKQDLQVLRLWAELAAGKRERYTLVADGPKRDQPSTAGRKRVLIPGTRPSIKWAAIKGGAGGGEKEMNVDVKIEMQVDVDVDVEIKKLTIINVD